MQARKLISKGIFVMALAVLGSAGASAQQDQPFAVIPPDGGGGGACANTICGGVTYCNYSAGYSCSMTGDSCTNRFC